MLKDDSQPLFSPKRKRPSLSYPSLHSEQPSTSRHSADDSTPRPFSNLPSKHPSASRDRSGRSGKIRLEVYCCSWEVDCGEADRIQADLDKLQTSTLTKLALQLVLFRKLAQQDARHRLHF
jgi:hypothetical protein